MENRITLLATYAKDRLVDSSGKLIRSQEGGPALFIANVFDRNKVKYDVPFRQDMEVEVMLTGSEELGKVTKKPDTVSVNYPSLDTTAIVISTILDEFSLDGIDQYNGKVFADVQGYVRDGEQFGQKKRWTLPSSLEDSFFCLKAADYEVDFIPPRLLEKQKQKLLLLTQGQKGCILFVNGEQFTFTPENIVEGENTLGAGDTFFASFIAEYLKKGSAQDSCTYAISNTYDFLLNKSSHSNQSS